MKGEELCDLLTNSYSVFHFSLAFLAAEVVVTEKGSPDIGVIGDWTIPLTDMDEFTIKK